MNSLKLIGNIHELPDVSIDNQVEYPCEHCSKVFTQHSRLVYHLNSHTNQRQFECDLCGKKFNTSQYVTTHKRKVHGDQEKLLKYTCELCGMRFKVL